MDQGTVANLLTLAGAILIGFGWLLRVIFARMREFFGRSEAEDEKIWIEAKRIEILRRDTDIDLYKQILEVKVQVANLLGDRDGYQRGLSEARAQAQVFTARQ